MEESKMTIKQIAERVWKAITFGAEVVDTAADLFVIGKTMPKGEKAMDKIKARIANIGRADEAIISSILSKLEDNDRAIFIGFKLWLANNKDKMKKVKHFILRRHLAFLYEKGEESEEKAVKTVLDIVSKLELGGNEATLVYCDG